MPDDLTPFSARARFRSGLRVPTAGIAAGSARAGLLSVPADLAGDLRRFAELNPRSCPLLDITAPGGWTTGLATGADLRTDLPTYRIWADGECVAEVTDAGPYWRDDLVTFLIGCGSTVDPAMVAAGLPVRHLELGVSVPAYRTSVECGPAGRFGGPMVVAMRPVPAGLLDRATEVTGCYPALHGGPVHHGDPAVLGIIDLDRPDFGDPVPVRSGEVPVFWASGLTMQAAVLDSKPPFAITHAPGHPLITDVPGRAYAI